MKCVALDSNVFLYALLDQPPVSQQAIKLLKSIELGEIAGIFSVLVYSEVLGGKTANNIKIAHQFLDDLLNMRRLEVSKQIAAFAGKLRQANPALKIADCIHLATAVESQANLFITHDAFLLKVAAKYIKVQSL